MKNNPFLPEGEQIPETKTPYTRFVLGENKIRVVGSAITGFELWVKAHPERRKTNSFTQEELANADINKYTGKRKIPTYFWAFPVYNYLTESFQILEVTQKKIINDIKMYLEDEDYGDPRGYDLVVVKYEEEGGQTKYSVKAKPPKPFELDSSVVDDWNISALYTGDDPFTLSHE